MAEQYRRSYEDDHRRGDRSWHDQGDGAHERGSRYRGNDCDYGNGPAAFDGGPGHGGQQSEESTPGQSASGMTSSSSQASVSSKASKPTTTSAS